MDKHIEDNGLVEQFFKQKQQQKITEINNLSPATIKLFEDILITSKDDGDEKCEKKIENGSCTLIQSFVEIAQCFPNLTLQELVCHSTDRLVKILNQIAKEALKK